MRLVKKMYSWRNIAFGGNIALIVFVSAVYFDSVKLFVQYDSYIHFTMYFSLGLLSIDLNKNRRLSYKIIFIILIPVLTENYLVSIDIPDLGSRG